MLNSIRLKNFKSFADQTVELSPLTLLVGANGAGKSNLLDALRFLQGIGLDLPLSDIFRGRFEGGREIWPGLRGGAQGALRYGSKSFTIESKWTLGKEELTHKITCQIEPEPLIEHESLEARTAGGRLFDAHPSSLKGFEGFTAGGVMKASAKKSRGMRGLAGDRNPARRSLLGQIEHHRGRAEEVGLADVIALCNALQIAMRSTLSIDIDPRQMRGYVRQEHDHLGTNGQHLSAVVRRLCLEGDSKAELLRWLRALSAPEIEDIEFVETDLGDVMMVLAEKDGARIPASGLPDGALRAFGELVAVMTAPEGSLLLLEDVERGFHPDRADLLAHILESATRPGACQILATTHSRSLLRATPPQALAQAVVFERDPSGSHTVAQKLGALPRFDEVVSDDPGKLLSASARSPGADAPTGPDP